MGGDPDLYTGGKITNENAEKSVITEVVLAVVTAQKQLRSGTVSHRWTPHLKAIIGQLGPLG